MSGERSWIQGDLTIPAGVLAEVEAHAQESYPSECCGFITGSSARPRQLDRAVREQNLADKYHALDPATFPRTSKEYFKIDELRAARAFAQGEETKQPIKVIYHSHCDAGAYFSAEDAATFSVDGQLMWPCAFLVVSVRQGAVEDRKLWVHQTGTDVFVESTLTVL